jgi:hypothetical protein
VRRRSAACSAAYTVTPPKHVGFGSRIPDPGSRIADPG